MRSDAARNRTRILEVARHLVSRDGPAVSMDDIAAEAGVAVGTLYRHFPDKAALIGAVVQDSVGALAVAAEAALARVDAGASAFDEMAELFRAYARRHSLDAAVKEVAASLGAYRPGALEPGSMELRAWDAISELIASAVREGAMRKDLTPADLLVLVAGVPVDPTPAEVRDRYVDIVLQGIRTSS